MNPGILAHAGSGEEDVEADAAIQYRAMDRGLPFWARCPWGELGI